MTVVQMSLICITVIFSNLDIEVISYQSLRSVLEYRPVRQRYL